MITLYLNPNNIIQITSMEEIKHPFPLCSSNCKCDEHYAGDSYELIEARIDIYFEQLGDHLVKHGYLQPEESRHPFFLYSAPNFFNPRLDLTNANFSDFDWTLRPSFKKLLAEVSYQYWDTRSNNLPVWPLDEQEYSASLPPCIRHCWSANVAANMEALEATEHTMNLNLPPPNYFQDLESSRPSNTSILQQKLITDFFTNFPFSSSLPKPSVTASPHLSGFICFRSVSTK